MKVRIVVINKSEEGESCEVYEYYGTEAKIEITEQEEPDIGINRGLTACAKIE